MAILTQPITIEQLRVSNWQDVIANPAQKNYLHYRDLFYARMKEEHEAGNEINPTIFGFLGAICSLWIKLDIGFHSLEPLWTLRDGRTSTRVQDFSDNELDLLSQIVNEVVDPEMKARIADILRIRRKNFYPMSLQSVSSYLESARNLEDPQMWIYTFARIACATYIANSLGGNEAIKEQTFNHIEDLLNRLNGTDPMFLSLNLMRLLLKFRKGGPQQYAELSERMGEGFKNTSQWRHAREYLALSAQWWEIAGNPDKDLEVAIVSVDTYLEEAEQDVPYKSNFRSALLLRDAVQGYKKIANIPEEKIDIVKREMLAYQLKSVADMHPVEIYVPFDEAAIRSLENMYTESVRGKEFEEAALILASLISIIDVKTLEKKVEHIAEECIVSSIMVHYILNPHGYVIEQRPPITGFGTPEEQDRAKKIEMYRQAKIDRRSFILMVVEPMRSQINIEHHIQLQDLLPLLINNPFVESGHEITLARGIQAGFQGDWMVCSHFLVPQMESMIRVALTQMGVIDSGLNRYDLQYKFPITHLLTETKYTNELDKLWGKNTTFDLRLLLVESAGGNLRNDLCHGLMADNEHGSIEVEYMWWIFIQILLSRLIVPKEENAQELAEGNGN